MIYIQGNEWYGQECVKSHHDYHRDYGLASVWEVLHEDTCI